MPPKKKGNAPLAPPSRAESRKGEDGPPSRQSRAAVLMDNINKKSKGRARLMSASDYRLPFLYKRLSTGLLTLDLELRGGFPAGGLSQVIGRKNAGKSLITWQMIRQLQYWLGDEMMVLLAMTEIPADRDQARKAGVRISMGQHYVDQLNAARKAQGQPPLPKEEVADLLDQVGGIHELHALTAEDFYDQILTAIEQNIYHLIVIDSIGNVLAAAEQEKDSVHDKTFGGSSAPNTRFLKLMTNLLTMNDEWGRSRDTCIIGINQVRDNLKDANKDYKAPGGNALEHAKLIDLFVQSGKMYKETKKVMTPSGIQDKDVAYAKDVHWTIEKGKAGIHEGARGTYIYDFRINNADFYTDTIVAGIKWGVIEAAGNWLGIPNPNEAGKYLLRENGKERFVKALETDAREKAEKDDTNTLMNYIRDACYRAAGITISYEWED